MCHRIYQNKVKQVHAQDGNSKGVVRTPETFNMENIATKFNGFFIILANLFILNVCGGPG